MLTVQPDGRSVEFGLIGKEGFAGLHLILGFKTSPLRIITQADGTAYRVDVPTLLKRADYLSRHEGTPGLP